jgi:peptidyl-prolyl cis-trans isomerase C
MGAVIVAHRRAYRLEMTLTDDRFEGDSSGAADTPAPPRADEPRDLNDTPGDVASPAADAPADSPRGPRMPVIIGAVVLLLALGVGLAFMIPPRSAAPTAPTADPAAAAPTAPALDGTAAAAIPTTPPMPEVIEGDPNEVIARVGEGQISRGDFARFYQPGGSPEDLLNQLIQRELVVQQGLKEGVKIDEAKVDAQLADIKTSQAGGDAARFQEFLDQAKLGTEDNLKRLLGHDQIIEQMILKYTTAEQVHARHILLSTENISDTASIKTEAEGLMKQLDEGADFAALAKEHSADPGSAANGGDLGWALRGMYVPEFDEAVFSMQPGERRLVQTQFGYHIIELVEPAAVRGIPSSDMLQTPSGQQAFNDTFLPWVEKLRQDADSAKQITVVIPADQLVAMPTTQ